jgi:hypothetical protein
MSDATTIPTTPILPTLDPDTIVHAVRNDYPGHEFVLGDRVFPVKDLDYDSYVEFMRLSKSIAELMRDAMDLSDGGDGKMGLNFNLAGLDMNRVIEVAGKDLPKLVLLCCRASDEKVTEKEVKRLAKRPQVLLEVVLIQIKHNKMVEEFVSFFPRIAGRLSDLVEDTTSALGASSSPPLASARTRSSS